MIVDRHTYGHWAVSVHHWEEDAQLEIGAFCSIADRVDVFLGGNHRADWVTTYPFAAFPDRWETAREIPGHPGTKGNVTVGNDVWIGSNATIMSGVTIGDGAVIAADSCVARDVEPYAIVAGNPARAIRHRFEPEVIEQLLRIRWWEWSDELIAECAPLLCSEDMARFLERAEALESAEEEIPKAPDGSREVPHEVLPWRATAEPEAEPEPAASAGAEVMALREENLRLTVRLERIQASLPMRAYATMRDLPGLRAVRRRRQAGFGAALARRAEPDRRS